MGAVDPRLDSRAAAWSFVRPLLYWPDQCRGMMPHWERSASLPVMASKTFFLPFLILSCSSPSCLSPSCLSPSCLSPSCLTSLTSSPGTEGTMMPMMREARLERHRPRFHPRSVCEVFVSLGCVAGSVDSLDFWDSSLVQRPVCLHRLLRAWPLYKKIKAKRNPSGLGKLSLGNGTTGEDYTNTTCHRCFISV